jgi:CBS domain-containing protein
MELRARDIMSREVISVPSDMDLRELAKMFLDKGITGAPVLDADGNLAGVVSQTDLVYYNLTRDDELVLESDFYQNARMEGRHVPTGFQIEDTNSGQVADVMTPVVHSVTERASIDSVARLMTREHIHRVIVRKGAKVAGVISALDVLRAHERQARSASAKRRTAGARA